MFQRSSLFLKFNKLVTDKKIYSDDFVTLEPVKHIYTDKLGNKYRSVSSVLKLIETPFDAKNISMAMAKRDAGRGASQAKIKEAQKAILAGWESKKNGSLDHGNFIHDNLELYFLNGRCENKAIESLGRSIYNELCIGFKRTIPEKIFYDVETKVAGSADLPVVRKENQKKPWILDIYDYKSNIEQGIRYDSIDRRKSPPKHYEEYYNDPFNHVEACNYYKYSMQISTYAYMAMKQYNIRIGRLAIIFVNENYQYNIIPVPFMFYEVKALFDHMKSLKSLPETKSSIATPLKDSVSVFDFYNDSEF